jgi:archaellin
VANFDVTTQNVATGFQYTGVWYNLMDNTTINVADVNAPISLAAGEYRIYGNKQANLAIADFEKENSVNLYPNPVTDYFTLNVTTTKVQVYSVTGQLVKSFATHGNLDFQFNVADLKTGLYLVKAVDENKKIQMMKFIKK